MQLVHSSYVSSPHLTLTRSVCSWHALLVPPLMQLVPSLHASSLYSIRVLLARATRIAVDAACVISERLGSLLDPVPWQEQTSPLMLQLVQSPNPSGLYSTRIPWQARTIPPMPQLVQSSKTPRAFTRPGFPGRHELSRRCYSLCSLRTHRVFTRPGFPGRHELLRRCYSL